MRAAHVWACRRLPHAARSSRSCRASCSCSRRAGKNRLAWTTVHSDGDAVARSQNYMSCGKIKKRIYVFPESDRVFSKSDRGVFGIRPCVLEIRPYGFRIRPCGFRTIRPCGFRNQTVVRAFPESDCVILESDRAFEIRLCICHDATMVYLVYLPWPSICTMVPPIYIPDTLWQHPAHGPPAIQL